MELILDYLSWSLGLLPLGEAIYHVLWTLKQSSGEALVESKAF